MDNEQTLTTIVRWIPINEAEIVTDELYWITDGKHIAIADCLSLKRYHHKDDWNQYNFYGAVDGLSVDGENDYELMDTITHVARYHSLPLPELPTKTLGYFIDLSRCHHIRIDEIKEKTIYDKFMSNIKKPIGTHKGLPVFIASVIVEFLD